jgi:hypothetical protein
MKTLTLAALTTLAAAGCVVALPSAASAAPACGNRALSITASQTQGFAGHGALVVRFRNLTAHTCTLYGYPGVDALNAQGAVMKHARRTLMGAAGGSPQINTIHLQSGGFASATVEWLNFNPTTTGACAFSHSIAVTPPNTTRTRVIPRSVSVCDLQVHPTVAGGSGQG